MGFKGNVISSPKDIFLFGATSNHLPSRKELTSEIQEEMRYDKDAKTEDQAFSKLIDRYIDYDTTPFSNITYVLNGEHNYQNSSGYDILSEPTKSTILQEEGWWVCTTLYDETIPLKVETTSEGVNLTTHTRGYNDVVSCVLSHFTFRDDADEGYIEIKCETAVVDVIDTKRMTWHRNSEGIVMEDFQGRKIQINKDGTVQEIFRNHQEVISFHFLRNFNLRIDSRKNLHLLNNFFELPIQFISENFNEMIEEYFTHIQKGTVPTNTNKDRYQGVIQLRD